MPRVIHFEIPADNTARAVKFYKDVFGWQIQKWDNPSEEYYLVTTGKDEPGIDGAIQPRPMPGATVVNTVSVPSVDEYVDKVVKAGGKVLQGKMPIPMMGWLAYLQDTEGNVFGIMQRDEKAM